MKRFNDLSEIKEITLHWSESNVLNKLFDTDDDGDIDEVVDITEFDKAVTLASKDLGDWSYDKTSLSVNLKNGDMWCSKSKFYLQEKHNNLLDLLNS